MPNVYSYRRSGSPQGALHAVLTWDDCFHVLCTGLAHYLGKHLPDLSRETTDFALFHVAAEEAEAEWAPGYYRLETDLVRLNRAILALWQ